MQYTTMYCICCSFFYTAISPLTRQRALCLLQVEDLMEGSLLGAVGATRLLLSAHPAWDGGEAAPRCHRLNLQRDGGGPGGKRKR